MTRDITTAVSNETTEQVVRPFTLTGVPLDYALRQFPFTLFFLRPPALETISDMLERESVNGSGWRKSQAVWWREELLADFDLTGSHGAPGRE